MSFERLGLAPELLRAVAAEGYVEPTPVQVEAIPLVLEGRDVLAGAQTGTGKTAAFVLPILQLLNARRDTRGARSGGPTQSDRPADQRVRRGGASHASGTAGAGAAVRQPIRCLVLTPTRELALQIEESVRTYGANRPVRSTTIYGGVGFEPQVRALRAGPEIVVATPGRLLDHAAQGTIDLRSVEILVLDEADRMLDMGFIRDIRRILELVPAVRQNLLFSATFSDEIRDLASGFLRDPAYVQIARRNAPIELVRQVVYPVDRERKRELLSHLVRSCRVDRALVFTRTKHGANRLAEQLGQDGISAAPIHGNRSQSQRVRALNDFKSGRVAILVATELAARGLDIDGLPHVVNFELPMVPADYVHRIGRTGRAGMEGDAISLVCIDESDLLADIQRLLRQPIPRETVHGFEVDRSIPREAIRQRSNDRARPMGRRPGASRPATPRPPAPRPAAPRPPVGPSVGRIDRPAGARPATGRAPVARPSGQAPVDRSGGARSHAGGPSGGRPYAGQPTGSRPSAPSGGSRPSSGPVGGRPARQPQATSRQAGHHFHPGRPGRPIETLPGERLARARQFESSQH